MKTWKLVSGIISIVLFAFVMFQSCAAGISNSLAENGESGGSAGLIVAIFYWLVELFLLLQEMVQKVVISH